MKEDLQIWKRVAKPEEAEEQKEVWFGNKTTRRVCSNEQKKWGLRLRLTFWAIEFSFAFSERENFLVSIYVGGDYEF